MSQAAFSKELNVTQPTLGRYEKGTRSPDADFVHLLYQQYNVNPNWIIAGIKPKYIQNGIIQPDDINPPPESNPVSEKKAKSAPDPKTLQRRITKLKRKVRDQQKDIKWAEQVIMVYERGQQMIEAFLHDAGMLDLAVLRPGTTPPPPGALRKDSNENDLKSGFEDDLDDDFDDEDWDDDLDVEDNNKAAG